MGWHQIFQINFICLLFLWTFVLNLVSVVVLLLRFLCLHRQRDIQTDKQTDSFAQFHYYLQWCKSWKPIEHYNFVLLKILFVFFFFLTFLCLFLLCLCVVVWASKKLTFYSCCVRAVFVVVVAVGSVRPRPPRLGIIYCTKVIPFNSHAN